VGWIGPNAANDNIELGRVGEPGYIDYAYVTEGNPVQIIMPPDPGTYELRYRFRDNETLVTRAIEATEAAVSLTAPDTAPAGATIDVAWAGPAAENDNIELGRVGEPGYLDYAYVRDGNPVQIILPAEPGPYELRYRFRDSETILARPITVTAAEVTLTAPDTAPAGSTIAVGWVGPNAENDNIQVALPGGSYLGYAYVRDGNPVQLRLPATPGTYELRYYFRDTQTIATRMIELTPVTVQLLTEPVATAGQSIIVGWDGPNYSGDYIEIGRPGDPGYDNYVYTSAGNPVTLVAPATPGSYEIRYLTGDVVLGTVPVEVK
jgi:Ca-activated chloride channel homolog